MPIRVLVADDHRLFRQGLIGLMNTRRDLVEVVGEASTGQEAVRMTHSLRPDVVLMDIHMPDGDGLQATACIRGDFPEVAVIMLTASESDDHLYQAVRLGAAGYLLKSLDADELFDLLSGVARGEVAMTRAMAARVLKSVANGTMQANQVDTLTEREIEVLKLVAQGASNPQIAEKLFITINTVKVHLRNIREKLRVENRAQAAAYAVRCGLVNGLEQDLPKNRAG
jgi:DNA-binding NarL/FixJ family response regulator